MDYPNSSDYHNFTQLSPSAHRLPTLNGTSALLDAIEKHRPIPTSIENLDIILDSGSVSVRASGGISRGTVTEIYGPPGCGKTHIGLQLAANVLNNETSAEVVWIDTSSSLPLDRLEHFLSTYPEGDPSNSNPDVEILEEKMSRLDHMHICDLTRLLGLVMHPPRNFLDNVTRLLVIDDFSNTVMTGLPQQDLSVSNTSTITNGLSREEIISRSVATRRAVMLGAVSAGLSRLAAATNIAVVIINKATSGRRSGESAAVLRSMLNASQWNEGITTRIVIYRDLWPSAGQDSNFIDCQEMEDWRKKPLRLAGVEKLGGRDIQSRGVKFVILQHKLQALEVPLDAGTTHLPALPASSPPPEEANEEAMSNLDLVDVDEAVDESVKMPEDILTTSSPAHGSKRKRDEIADSEDEEDLLAIPHDRPSVKITNAKGGRFTTKSTEDYDEMLLK